MYKSPKNEDDLIWLAKELAYPVWGTTDIEWDWGNYKIECYNRNLKELLADMARDYAALKQQIKHDRAANTTSFRITS